MRRYGILIVTAFVLALAALRSLPSPSVLAGPLLDGATSTATATATPTPTATTETPTKSSTPTITPTVVWLFPLVAFQATFTPTRTPTQTPSQTPTATQPATQTPTHAAYTITTGHLSGNIYWLENRPVQQYYMTIEWIKFLWWFYNNSSNSIERYEIAGVNVFWPDGVRNAFHTSWTGSPDYVAANCYGANGNTLDWSLPLRCGSDIASAQNQDHIGASSDIPVDEQGTYTLQFNVCQSASVAQCESNGEWHKLGDDLTMVAVPPPTPGIPVTPAAPRGPVCHLIMTDASHGRLECSPYTPERMRPGELP